MAGQMIRTPVKTTRGAGNLEIGQVPIPRIGPDEVLLRVHACGICGRDLRIEADQHPYAARIVIGHGFAGEIAEKGRDVVDWSVLDRDVSEQHTHA